MPALKLTRRKAKCIKKNTLKLSKVFVKASLCSDMLTEQPTDWNDLPRSQRRLRPGETAKLLMLQCAHSVLSRNFISQSVYKQLKREISRFSCASAFHPPRSVLESVLCTLGLMLSSRDTFSLTFQGFWKHFL